MDVTVREVDEHHNLKERTFTFSADEGVRPGTSSGLQSIAYGAEKIMLGAADTIIAGGAESMSIVPMMGHIVRPNAALAETAPEYYMGMGHTAEQVAVIRPDDLGAYAVRETLKRAGGYEGNIDDLIIGCATPEAEQGLNMARNIGALAGLPHTVPAVTINRYCRRILAQFGKRSVSEPCERTEIAGENAAYACERQTFA
ncbi:hypothetical protein DT075_11615 [Bacillus licheniformis]|nr:hypothetical protein DT075_11615 [Bacillus licheniformis]